MVSMAFIAQLLVMYEMAGVVLGPHALRNGADTWLRRLLESIGFGQYFLLPLLTCGILFSWHHLRRDAWRLQGGVLTTMLLESTLLALVLFGLAHLQRALFAPVTASISGTHVTAQALATVSRLIAYCGAGIYEELLFRLIMLPAIAAAFAALGLSWRSSWGWSILATSLLFSAAHYHTFAAGGYAFDWYTFSFRFMAGLFFSGVFVARGFGIAVGSHAMYDIFVEVI
jgi:membrane protease YdiL (CAAX protease family)